MIKFIFSENFIENIAFGKHLLIFIVGFGFGFEFFSFNLFGSNVFTIIFDVVFFSLIIFSLFLIYVLYIIDYVKFAFKASFY